MEETVKTQLQEALTEIHLHIQLSSRGTMKVAAAAAAGNIIALVGAKTVQTIYTKRLRPWIAEKSTKNTEK